MYAENPLRFSRRPLTIFRHLLFLSAVVSPLLASPSPFLVLSPHRPTHNSSSPHHPLHQYYAEHVSSLRLYRVWLRDQAAHSRKAAFGDGADRVL
jgi:hypothetical protein